MQLLAFNDIPLRSEHMVAIATVTLGCLVAMVGIVGATISGIVKSRAREQTRREIAAYVAEGTIDADKAVEILNAGQMNIARQIVALGNKETHCKC